MRTIHLTFAALGFACQAQPEEAKKPEAKAEAKADIKTEAKAEAKADTKAEAKADTEPVVKADIKAEVKAEAKTEAKAETRSEGPVAADPLAGKGPAPKSATVNGAGLDAAQIRTVIRDGMAGIRNCYTEGLKKDPDLKGKIDVGFKIDPAGKVKNASAKNTSFDAATSDCIVKVVGKLTFPKPSDGKEVEVVYPFLMNVAE